MQILTLKYFKYSDEVEIGSVFLRVQYKIINGILIQINFIKLIMKQLVSYEYQINILTLSTG